jgi:hypothetical protein
MENTIEIQKKAKPVVPVTILVLVVLSSAIWVLISFVFPMLHGFSQLKITAISVIAVVAIWAIRLVVKQSSRTKPGLTIDERGITDHSSIASVGFIPWSDIISVKEDVNIFKQKLIIVVVRNPHEYINKTSVMRESRKAQYKQFESPIVIATKNLEYSPQDLVSVLENRVGIESRQEE